MNPVAAIPGRIASTKVTRQQREAPQWPCNPLEAPSLVPRGSFTYFQAREERNRG